MLRPLRFFAVVSLFACALHIVAQDFQPKAIRFEGAPDQDQARLLAITGLTPGATVTKEQIEAGLGKLADTGSFTDISYTVNSQALVIKLGSSDNAGLLPVRFANFLWWKPEELERLLEAEVPIYHGQISLTGSLTTEVEAALVKLAKQKGLDIKVSAEHGAGHIVLSIDQPHIVVGRIAIDDVRPALGPKISDFVAGMRGQDLDVVTTATTITEDGRDIFRNAGYLDVAIDPPVFTEPHPLAAGTYAVDAKVTVHRGDIYKVVELAIVPAQPLQESELRAVSELKKGDPAAPMGLLISGQKMARLYADRGYLDASATQSISLDNVAHTAAYTLTLRAGTLYHVAGILTGALPVDAQTELAKDKRLSPGLPADNEIGHAIAEDLMPLYPHRALNLGERVDRLEHTVTYVVEFRTAAPRD